MPLPKTQPLDGDVQFESTVGVVDLTWGHPDPSYLPVDEVAAAAETVLRERGRQALSYGAPAGGASLRNAVAAHLAAAGEGAVDPREVLVTAGASGGIDLVLSLMARPGDVVFVERPTYFLALRIFADHGLEVIGLAGDDEGPIAADLTRRATVVGTGADRRAFFYCIPTFANPTGRSWPERRRRELLETADRCQVVVIEDDVYRDTAAGPPPSMWSIDPSNVIRLGSFSKSLAPGLRVGFLTADRSVVASIEKSGVLDSGGGVNHFAAMVVSELVSSGVFGRIARQAQTRYADRRRALLAAIDPAVLEHRAPDGGFFVWLRVPPDVTSEAFVAAAKANGVLVTDGRPFFAGAPTGEFVRASFSMLDEQQLGIGGELLMRTALARS